MYVVVYHDSVVTDDIPKLSSTWKQKIQKSIEAKLQTRPDFYGKPLRRSLRGYRKLRVGDYRVIFKIEQKTVKILMIEHRSVVYAKVKKRSGLN